MTETKVKTKKPIFKKWWFWVLVILLIIIIKASTGGSGSSSTPVSKPATTTTQSSKSAPAKVKQRVISGKATNLGAGTFQGGKDIPAGLYDVTAVKGTGNFTVNSSGGDLKINEVLGSLENMGVAKVRAQIAKGDTIQLQGISKTHFEPVTTPFVTSVKEVTIYSGIWTVGEDIAAGRYKATTQKGSGNFVVYDENGIPGTNEILGGDNGVKDITVDLKSGNTLDIGGLNQVTLTPIK